VHDHKHDHKHDHAHAHDHAEHDHHRPHSHDHHDHDNSSGGGACCGGHGHSHGHSHEHFDAATEPSPLLRAVGRTGFFSLSETLEHGTVYSLASVACFAASLLLQYALSVGALTAHPAGAAAAALLAATYFLSGAPQLAETLVACVRGRIDTHVLMSLSVVGTLYMGMAAEVSALRVVWILVVRGRGLCFEV